MSDWEKCSTAARCSGVRSPSRRSAAASSRSRTRFISSRNCVSTGTAASPATHCQYFSTSSPITARRPAARDGGARRWRSPPRAGRRDRRGRRCPASATAGSTSRGKRDVEDAQRTVAAPLQRRRARARRVTTGRGDAVEQSSTSTSASARPRFVVVHRRRAVAARRAPARARTCGWRRSPRARLPAAATRARAPPSRPRRAPSRACPRASRRSSSPAAPPPSSRSCAPWPSAVSLRTRPPTSSALWNSRLSTVPDAGRLASHASRTWPWICASPTTIESMPGGDAEEMRHGLAIATHVAVAARVGAEPLGEQRPARAAPPRRSPSTR